MPFSRSFQIIWSSLTQKRLEEKEKHLAFGSLFCVIFPTPSSLESSEHWSVFKRSSSSFLLLHCLNKLTLIIKFVVFRAVFFFLNYFRSLLLLRRLAVAKFSTHNSSCFNYFMVCVCVYSLLRTKKNCFLLFRSFGVSCCCCSSSHSAEII